LIIKTKYILNKFKDNNTFLIFYKMDIKIKMNNYLENDIKIDNIKFQKMLLLFNAIEEGWSIKKKNDSYIFSKNHEGKKEVFEDNYLNKFMKTNFDIKSFIS